MNSLRQQIKKDEAYPSITPRIAFLLNLFFLKIETMADSRELDEWIDGTEVHGCWLDMLINDNCKKKLLVERLIKKVAPYAHITPRTMKWLKHFFLDRATQEERDEIDNWMHECEANDRLFDLLLQIKLKKSGTETVRMIKKLLKVRHAKGIRQRLTDFLYLDV
jgi:hypothetical protein